MNSALCYKISDAQVAHEIVGGEAVIINLESGICYGLQGCGSDIWELIGTGTLLEHIIDDICHSYHGDRQEIEQGVKQLIAQLQAEGLIQSTTLDNTSDVDNDTAGEAHAEKAPFEMPDLELFSDIQDLLLPDPIHNIDQAG